VLPFCGSFFLYWSVTPPSQSGPGLLRTFFLWVFEDGFRPLFRFQTTGVRSFYAPPFRRPKIDFSPPNTPRGPSGGLSKEKFVFTRPFPIMRQPLLAPESQILPPFPVLSCRSSLKASFCRSFALKTYKPSNSVFEAALFSFSHGILPSYNAVPLLLYVNVRRAIGFAIACGKVFFFLSDPSPQIISRLLPISLDACLNPVFRFQPHSVPLR